MRFLTTSLLLCLLLLTGCSWLGFGDDEDEKPETEGYTEQDFFDVIQRQLNASQWEEAIKNLEALEAQFPFGDYAEQSQLELVYAHYKKTDYEAAIAAADRFIRLHPQHPNVDYAIYMKGLSSYSQSRGFINNYLPLDPTLRDPATARDSFASFTELLNRFPGSTYAPDARQRMIYLRNLLARQEIHVANYYFKRGAYLAAANRGRYVVENYQQTPAVPDALAVMAEAYHLLGLNELAGDAAKLLAINYPEHPALDKAGNFDYWDESGSERTWLNLLTLGFYGKFDKPPSYDSRIIYNPVDIGKDELPENSEAKKSWWSWMTFGLFDKEKK